MSMTVHYKHISPWLLDLFAMEPGLVEPFTVISLSRSLAPGDSAPSKKKRMKESDLFLDGMVEEMKEVIESISAKYAARILQEAKSNGYTLYKYFENVQFHISGEITDHGTTLLSQAVTGVRNIGPDGPYGSATFLSGSDVEKVAKMLLKISDHQFLTQYSPAEWQWDKQTTKYALDYFKGFVSYYAEAAKVGHAVLIWGA